MFKVDKLCFLLILIRIVIIFVLWYFIIIGKKIPIYYNTLRRRYIYKKNLWNKVKENEYVIKAIEKFYSIRMLKIVQEVKTIAVLTYYKNIILLNDNIKSKRYYFETGEDIVNVCFKLENESGLKKKGYKKVIKRYYKKSNYSLVKITGIITVADKVMIVPMKLVGTVGQNFVDRFSDAITTNNVSKEIKIQKNLSNSQVENILKLVAETKTVAYDHRGLVQGVKVNEDGSVNLTYFEAVTSTANHEINLNLSPEEVNLLKKVNDVEYKIPTISMPENKTIKIEDFSMIYKSAIKTPLINHTGIKLNEKNVMKIPKGLGKELQEKTDGFMEVIGWKEYEFFYKGIMIFGIHKEYIYREWGKIKYVDMSKAKPVTLGDYAKISMEIANNPEVDKFINIDLKTKEIYEKNYKIMKDLKKD